MAGLEMLKSVPFKIDERGRKVYFAGPFRKGIIVNDHQDEERLCLVLQRFKRVHNIALATILVFLITSHFLWNISWSLIVLAFILFAGASTFLGMTNLFRSFERSDLCCSLADIHRFLMPQPSNPAGASMRKKSIKPLVVGWLGASFAWSFLSIATSKDVMLLISIFFVGFRIYFITGCQDLAESKGQSRSWGLLGILGIFGLIPLLFFRNKTTVDAAQQASAPDASRQ